MDEKREMAARSPPYERRSIPRMTEPMAAAVERPFTSRSVLTSAITSCSSSTPTTAQAGVTSREARIVERPLFERSPNGTSMRSEPAPGVESDDTRGGRRRCFSQPVDSVNGSDSTRSGWPSGSPTIRSARHGRPPGGPGRHNGSQPKPGSTRSRRRRSTNGTRFGPMSDRQSRRPGSSPIHRRTRRLRTVGRSTRVP